jgi:hypothetical protein
MARAAVGREHANDHGNAVPNEFTEGKPLKI